MKSIEDLATMQWSLVNLLMSKKRPFSYDEIGKAVYMREVPVRRIHQLVRNTRNSGWEIQNFERFGYGINVINPDPKYFLRGNDLKAFEFIKKHGPVSNSRISKALNLTPSQCSNLLSRGTPLSEKMVRYGSSKRLVYSGTWRKKWWVEPVINTLEVE
ncbi:MAG: hypothetical protein AAGD25_06305 [Cyanobacteria bacterium P01_F01_bin.150]